MSAAYPAADLAAAHFDPDEVASPGGSWHWELYARVLAGLQAAGGDRVPCTPDLLAAAESVMRELSPIVDALARIPAIPAPRAVAAVHPAGSR